MLQALAPPAPHPYLSHRHTLSCLLARRACAQLADGEVSELCARSSDGWVVGKVSGDRLFFALFDSTRFNSLTEVNHEMQALSAIHFSNIFSI